jgi:hypothetical protein
MAKSPLPHNPTGSGQMPGQSPGHRPSRRLVVTGGVAAVVVAVAVVGMGADAATRGYWYLPGHNPLLAHGQACGTVAVDNNALTASEASIQAAIACFTTAYAQCRAATLVSTTGGLDTGINRTFIIVPGRGQRGGCGVLKQWDGESDAGLIHRSGDEVCMGVSAPRDLPNLDTLGGSMPGRLRATLTFETAGSPLWF